MIRTCGLVKHYGKHLALDDVSFEVETGEILGLLGPNGAGKTTTMNILSGCMLQDKGTATVAGFDVSRNPQEATRRLGYLPEIPPLYPSMTVEQYLEFVARIKRLDSNRRGRRIAYAKEATGIVHRSTSLISTLSKGYRQRVGLASAILHDPEVLILDEPTIGLDPNQIVEIRDLILRLSTTKTVILSTHILHEVQAICKRVAIINRGRIMAVDSVENLCSEGSTRGHLRLEIAGDLDAIEAELRKVEGVEQVTCTGKTDDVGQWRVDGERGRPLRAAVYNAIKPTPWVLLEMSQAHGNLEEVFSRLTREKGGNRE